MAEANVMEVEMVDLQGSQMKYFCHQCSLEINPKLPDLICPLCDSGCVEELTENLRRDRESISSSPNVTNQILMDLLSSQPSRTRYNDDDNDDDDDEVWPRSSNSISSRSSSSRRWQQRGDRGVPLHSFIESILESLRDDPYRQSGPNLRTPIFRRYSRDFRRNNGGHEDLITQILTQLTACGPEPASQSQIDELPLLNVKKHHLDNSAQCSICLENFVLHEEVTTLPCNHLHHRYCIIPWLQLHATCPVCRHCLVTDTSEHARISSPYHFTDRNDLSLEPDDLAVLENAIEEADPTSVNLSVHPAWDAIRIPGLENQVPSKANEFDNTMSSGQRGITGNVSSALSSPDIEMISMENNNVAMDTEYDDAILGAVGGELRPGNVGVVAVPNSELSSLSPHVLTYLKDIEVTGLESEVESDL